MKIAGNTVIYDGDCPACANLVRHIASDKRARGFSFEKSQQLDFENINPQIDKAEAAKYVIYITAEGEKLKGSEAIAAIMKQMGGMRKLLGILMMLPLLKQLAGLGYCLFAYHRHSISRHLSEN